MFLFFVVVFIFVFVVVNVFNFFRFFAVGLYNINKELYEGFKNNYRGFFQLKDIDGFFFVSQNYKIYGNLWNIFKLDYYSGGNVYV